MVTVHANIVKRFKVTVGGNFLKRFCGHSMWQHNYTFYTTPKFLNGSSGKVYGCPVVNK